MGQFDSASLTYLLSRSKRYPLLTPEQEITLGRKIRQWQDWEGGPEAAPAKVARDGKKALDRFVCSNIRLAVYSARKYSNSGVPIEDLVQSAIAGLTTAYKRFRPELGNRSSSFAIWYARQACQQCVAKQGPGVRLPSAVNDAVCRLRAAMDRLSRRGVTPSAAELSEMARIPEHQLDQYLGYIHSYGMVLSLDYTPGDAGKDGRAPLSPSQYLAQSADAPSSSQELAEVTTILRDLIAHTNHLTPQERYILKCRYLEPDQMALPRLASKLHMNRETIRKSEARGIAKLRSLMPDQAQAYLDLF